MASEHNDEDARRRARLRGFELISVIQAGVPEAFDELSALNDEARNKGWFELNRIAVFGLAVREWLRRSQAVAGAVDELIAASEIDGDTAMLALGLALRSDRGFGDSSHKTGDAADLARAVVLLEGAEGSVPERITAHTACGISLANRSLFELADEQYSAAFAIGEKEPPGTLDFLLAPIMFNRAELGVAWASVLRQLGDDEGVARRWNSWTTSATATTQYAIPESWETELIALGLLLGAIAKVDTAAEASRVFADLGDGVPDESRRTFALLQLAVALADVDSGRSTTTAPIERAIASIDSDIHPQIYDLALCVSAELEARRGESSGLRYAKRELQLRWATRLESLRSMEASIDAERFAVEREVLSANALSDDLTGIGNRRALDRYRHGLTDSGARSAAVIIIDINGFKHVNDRHGHLVGDAVLVALARILSDNVRVSDLAIRFGGDEFAAVLADTDLFAASARAEKIVDAFDHHSFDEVGPGIFVTLSAGAAAGDATRFSELWTAADVAMYRAKAAAGSSPRASRVEPSAP